MGSLAFSDRRFMRRVPAVTPTLEDIMAEMAKFVKTRRSVWAPTDQRTKRLQVRELQMPAKALFSNKLQ